MFIIISVLIEGRKRFSVVYVLLVCVKYYISERKSKTYFLKIAHMKIIPEHTHLYMIIYISKVFANSSFYFNVHLKCVISWYASKPNLLKSLKVTMKKRKWKSC